MTAISRSYHLYLVATLGNIPRRVGADVSQGILAVSAKGLRKDVVLAELITCRMG